MYILTRIGGGCQPYILPNFPTKYHGIKKKKCLEGSRPKFSVSIYHVRLAIKGSGCKRKCDILKIQCTSVEIPNIILENTTDILTFVWGTWTSQPIVQTSSSYRPQTMFVKVMFSQVSVCPQGGVWPIACWDTPPGRHPPVQCMLGYIQQAGGTHPTGMHSCILTVMNMALC